MMEFFDWFAQPLSMGGQMVICAGTLGAGGVAAAIVRMAVRGQHEGTVAAVRGSDVATVVDFPKSEKVRDHVEHIELDLGDLIPWGRAAGAGAGEPDRGDLDEESDEIADVLPLLPRAQRAALRAGGAR